MAFHNDLLMNMMKMHAASQGQSYSFVRIGWIKDYDPATNCVKVGFFNANSGDYDLMSGWLPHIVPSMGMGDDTTAGEGNQWGFVHPPNIDSQAICLSYDGEYSNAVVIGGSYSEIAPPPGTDGSQTQMGEFLWMHKSGSYLKFWNNGDVTLYSTGDFNLHADGNLNGVVKGDIRVAAGGAITLASDKAIIEQAKSQILLDTPAVNTTQNLNVGNAATGTFTVDGNITVVVVNGIVVNIF